jgi:2-keto-4-pentenoate hydratase/2-oxohepta-3-ene-1,7-dioic acid hydratase in catechol pathway
MRLATARVPDGGTRLLAAGPDGHRYFDVGAAAGPRCPRPVVDDVGSLYLAGHDAVEAVRRAAAGVGPDQGPGMDLDSLDLAPPVTHPRSIVCVGRNYRAHIEEGDAPVPEFPVLFSKFANTLVGDREPVIRHAMTTQLDYEGELAVVIGRRASRVVVEDAMAHVAGYTILNDISARDLQLGDVQWIRGKSLDTFCPLGPVFVSADEVADVGALRIETRVNGELRQDAPVSDMIFSIPELIAFITQGITLVPGDIVATGTPAGTGYGMNPRTWLLPGDLVEITIPGLGTLHSTIEAPR